MKKLRPNLVAPAIMVSIQSRFRHRRGRRLVVDRFSRRGVGSAVGFGRDADVTRRDAAAAAAEAGRRDEGNVQLHRVFRSRDPQHHSEEHGEVAQKVGLEGPGAAMA